MCEKYNVSYKFLRRVNLGEKILKEGLHYPLRPILSKITNEEAEEIRQLLKNSNLSYKEIGEKFNQKIDRISEINNGETYKNNNYTYPIRKMVHFLTEEELNQVITLLENSSLTMIEIGEKFKISPAAVHYINKGISYYNKNRKYPIRE